MMNVNYNTLLMSELRIVPITMGDKMSDESIVKAITMNREIQNLGFTLSPAGIVMLAKSPDCDRFFEIVKATVGEVKAKPMYPDFPSQVMAIDEATFRFHQLMHYFSTYGAELFTGQPVSKGWLPDVEDTEKFKDDKTLLDFKVIDLIDKKDMYIMPYTKILSRRERVTDKDKMIIAECIRNVSFAALSGVRVSFKENLISIFEFIFDADDLTSTEKIGALRALCQHTGDVYKCMVEIIKSHHFHFTTSQKRMTVKLLECFPIDDFTANLMLSNKKREEVLFVLRYLDFNTYSRVPAYAEEVKMLRNKELRSWESGAKKLVTAKSPKALEYYSTRPGIMLRHLTYLLRNGYKAEKISEALCSGTKRSGVSIQTLVSLLNFFSGRFAAEFDDEAHAVRGILMDVLQCAFAEKNTPIRGKKVFVDDSDFDLDLSEIRVTDKSAEGGYIRSGLVYKIPDDVNRMRFFVYWNDRARVDVDLHMALFDADGNSRSVGWNASFIGEAFAFSGDITHSDAAEYVDVDLAKAAEDNFTKISTNINLYAGQPTFKDVEEIYVGAMAVDSIGRDVKLYNPSNCFFTHYLTGAYAFINYGYIDIVNRVIRFDGVGSDDGHRSGHYYTNYKTDTPAFTVNDYLHNVFWAQGAELVTERDDADVVLVIGKPSMENEISLIDENFFMD